MSDETKRQERLAVLRSNVSAYLDEIAAEFKEPVKLTILARVVAHPDGSQNFMMSDDTEAEAVEALQRLWQRGRSTAPDAATLPAALLREGR